MEAARGCRQAPQGARRKCWRAYVLQTFAALRTLRDVAPLLVPEELPSDVIESICDVLLRSLTPLVPDAEPADKRRVFAELRQRFPNSKPDVFDKALAQVNVMHASEPAALSTAITQPESATAFGDGIPFSFEPAAMELPPNFHAETPSPVVDAFAALAIATPPAIATPALATPSSASSRPSVPRGAFLTPHNEASWLKTRCEREFGTEAAAMAVAIFEMLRSQRTSDQLQGELFDLLGDR